jgi:hypothetical protein
MKKLIAVMILSICLSCSNLFAGDREWATAGKILTGVVVADVLFNHIPERHNHYEHRQVYYATSQPQVIYYTNPQPVIIKPNPTIIVENRQVWVPTGVVNEIKYTNPFYDSRGNYHPARQYVEQKQTGYYTTVQEKRVIPNNYSCGY